MKGVVLAGGCRTRLFPIAKGISKQFEPLWKQYSKEGVKKGVSVVQFFESNGVPYGYRGLDRL